MRQEILLRAFSSGSPTRTGHRLVRARHHRVDRGFTVPSLDDYFSNITGAVRTWVHGNFIVFYHERPYAVQNVELVIFRRSMEGRKLVNLRPTDDGLLGETLTG